MTFKNTGSSAGLPVLIIIFLSVSTAMGIQGCSGPAGKAATYKAKQISPVHNTAVEKAEKKAKKAGKKVDKTGDKIDKTLGSDDGLFH